LLGVESGGDKEINASWQLDSITDALREILRVLSRSSGEGGIGEGVEVDALFGRKDLGVDSVERSVDAEGKALLILNQRGAVLRDL